LAAAYVSRLPLAAFLAVCSGSFAQAQQFEYKIPRGQISIGIEKIGISSTNATISFVEGVVVDPRTGETGLGPTAQLSAFQTATLAPAGSPITVYYRNAPDNPQDAIIAESNFAQGLSTGDSSNYIASWILVYVENCTNVRFRNIITKWEMVRKDTLGQTTTYLLAHTALHDAPDNEQPQFHDPAQPPTSQGGFIDAPSASQILIPGVPVVIDGPTTANHDNETILFDVDDRVDVIKEFCLFILCESGATQTVLATVRWGTSQSYVVKPKDPIHQGPGTIGTARFIDFDPTTPSPVRVTAGIDPDPDCSPHAGLTPDHAVLARLGRTPQILPLRRK
jgi:hypothetical protein